MTATPGPRQTNTPHDVSKAVNSMKESTRLTRSEHESEFKHQVRLDKDELVAHETMSGPAAKVSRSVSSKHSPLLWFANIVTYFHVSLDKDELIVPETRLQSIAKSNIDRARAAAEVLVSMSAEPSPLLWFANKVTHVKDDANWLCFPKRARVARMRGASDQAYWQPKIQQMQMPCQHGNWGKAMKGIPTHEETTKCIVNWGKFKKGKRSRRIKNKNPMSTFLRGGLLCRWR